MTSGLLLEGQRASATEAGMIEMPNRDRIRKDPQPPISRLRLCAIAGAVAAAVLGAGAAFHLGPFAHALHAASPAAVRLPSPATPSPRRIVHTSPPSTADARPAAVLTVGQNRAGIRIPGSFLGLSAEYWELPQFARHLSLFRRTAGMLRVRGEPPVILRIGGDSASVAVWSPGRLKPAAWAYRLDDPWLTQTSRLVRDAHLRVILDLNLVDRSPQLAAGWVRAALEALPAKSLVALEIGNEPDLFSSQRQDPIYTRDIAALDRYFAWTEDYTAATYVGQLQRYAAALRIAAPHVPLAGPSLAALTRNWRWLLDTVAAGHGWLAALTAHRYPFTACASPESRTFPTVPRLLSPGASAGLAAAIRPAVVLAHRHHLQFRLTELNSVTCSGVRGVSESFATALWVTDALFELVHAGVDGANLHVRLGAYNAPFSFTAHGLSARPLLYGLALFTRMLAPRARLLPTSVHAAARVRLAAWAVRVNAKDLRLLLINKGAHDVEVVLRLHRARSLTVQRLLAPSVAGRGGETLAGQRIGRNGRWQGRRMTIRVPRVAGTFAVTVPGYSAALLHART